MPIKLCICATCHLEVPKASTLYIGDGKRACKTHPDTAEKAVAAQKELEPKLQRPPFYAPYGGERQEAQLKKDIENWAAKQCWLCSGAGTMLTPDHARLLAVMKRLGWKAEDFYPFSEALIRDVRTSIAKLGVALLKVDLPGDPRRRGPVLDRLSVHPGSDRAVVDLGWLNACPACIVKYKLAVEPELLESDLLFELSMIFAVRELAKMARERKSQEAPVV